MRVFATIFNVAMLGIFYLYVNVVRGAHAFGVAFRGRPSHYLVPHWVQYSRKFSALYYFWTESNDGEDPFVACWAADTWTVNPSNDTRIESLLQRLNSPAPQSYFVLKRAVQLYHNKSENNSLPNVLRQCCYLLKPGFQFVMKEDEWNIVAATEREGGWQRVLADGTEESTLEISHEALDLAIDAADSHASVDCQWRDMLVQQAKSRLELTLGTDVRGRASADTAFCFAMAGVDDDLLYRTLAKVAHQEIGRVGRRPSFRSKYLLQMVEKLAASGLRGQEVEDVYRVAANCLFLKKEQLDAAELLCQEPCQFDLLSTRPLLWLWRFSARLRKATSIKPVISPPWSDGGQNLDWVQNFKDPSKPLVVDIGCGMGVSSLGLATLSSDEHNRFHESPIGSTYAGLDWRECNFVGGDLNQLTTGYARGIARRWEVDNRVQFVYSSADDLLEKIQRDYPGKVALLMIQFPTPFRLREEEGGNSQLPFDPTGGFMVTEELLTCASSILAKSGGLLLLQSNCEDVAVMMRKLAEEAASFEACSIPDALQSQGDIEQGAARLPQRTVEWVRQGGERAIGEGWSQISLIPPRGATESEVSCQLTSTPIHRCLLRCK